MKRFGLVITTAASFIFAVLWRREVNVNGRLRSNTIHKEFAHMDLRGDIINVLTKDDSDEIKEELQDALTRDVQNFFETKHAGDDWAW
jgi:hypothetical protein